MAERQQDEWGVADFLLASKRCDMLALEQLLRMGQLVAAISDLVHALQRERGVSNVYVVSGGRRFGAQLPGRVAEAQRMERVLRERLREIDPATVPAPSGSRLFSGIAHVVHGLEELNDVRGDIQRLRLTSEAVVDGYSRLIRGLLAVVFDAADTAVDPDISRLLVAMFHLMQGKELAGQERAVGAAGFARGAFDARSVTRLRHLIEGQERYFQIFVSFADPASLAAWEATEREGTEIERLRRIAFASVGDGRVDPELSGPWFERTTCRIDTMKRVEDTLAMSLGVLCERKLAAARDDLACHRDQIAALAKAPPERAAFAFFIDQAAMPPSLDDRDGGYPADCTRAQLGRSLADLVRSQSLRLQAMSEELQAARAALKERKTIERAKGLVMRHHGIGEEEAYALLRSVAMAQNRRLVDVAADAIAMADLLREPKPGGGR